MTGRRSAWYDLSVTEPLRVFVGYDPRESIAYHVACHSLITRTSTVVSCTPLSLDALRGVFDRPRDPKQSTDFAFTRFLVPMLSSYQGWSLYVDCDVLVREDLTSLWSLRDERYAVMVVKHDYVPSTQTKFLNQPQTAYPRKNWSSVMLFNNARCRALTREYVHSASGLDLHQFRWLQDEEIGSIPARWNHLVGEAPHDPDAAIVHYTLGGPYFGETRHSEFADEWFAELEKMRTGLSG